MTDSQRHRLTSELVKVGSGSGFYVDWKFDKVGSRGHTKIALVRFGIRPKDSKSIIDRNTININPTEINEFTTSGVILLDLTPEEKELICDLVCAVAKKIGLGLPKLNKKESSKDFLAYTIR